MKEPKLTIDKEEGQESVDTPEYYVEERLKLGGGIFLLKPSKMQWVFNG